MVRERQKDGRTSIMQERIYSSRRKGRPQKRWWDDVRKDLQIMRIANWTEKARNKYVEPSGRGVPNPQRTIVSR